MLFVSGQLCVGLDGVIAERHRGKVGSKVTPSDGREAAQLCLLQVLAQARRALGDLSAIRGCLRLGGFVNADPDLTDLAAVMNGASELIVDLLGESGRHARTTVGVATLPLGACVEVEALFEVDVP